MNQKVSISQEQITHLLKNYNKYTCYYVGGTLCFDIKISDYIKHGQLIHDKYADITDVLMLNLNETFTFSKGFKYMLSIENSVALFDFYRKIKGRTGYWEAKLSLASIRYVYDMKTQF